MYRRPQRYVVTAGLVLVLSATAAAGEQREGVGFHAGTYLDGHDPLLGIEYQLPIDSRVTFVPNAEYVFVDGGDMFTLNLDGKYSLNPSAPNPMWVGAGIGMIDRDRPFGDSTDPAFNVKWGMDFESMRGNFTPFVNAKAAFSDDSEFALSFGIHFGKGATTTRSVSNDS